MWNGGDQQFPIYRKNYDDDIDSLCYSKTDSDLMNWFNNTGSLVKRLIMNPDASKADPQALIDKLNSRLQTMKTHLKKRGMLTSTPAPVKGIAKPVYVQRGTQTADSVTFSENLVPQMEERVLRVPPPHLREEKSDLQCDETLSQRIEKEPNIYIK